jgi:quercetin dioxygenase-like cupin family protein
MSDLAIIGPLGVRRFHLEKVCETNEGHKHNYDHVTLVIRGRIKVQYRYEKDGQVVEGETKEFGPGEHLVVKAEVFHTIKALEPDTVYNCVFSHRDFDGLVTQTYVGNDRAYV